MLVGTSWLLSPSCVWEPVLCSVGYRSVGNPHGQKQHAGRPLCPRPSAASPEHRIPGRPGGKRVLWGRWAGELAGQMSGKVLPPPAAQTTTCDYLKVVSSCTTNTSGSVGWLGWAQREPRLISSSHWVRIQGQPVTVGGATDQWGRGGAPALTQSVWLLI